jgi:PUA domain protein
VVLKLPKRKRHFLKSKDAKKFLLDVSETLGQDIVRLLGEKNRVEVDETETAEVFVFNQRPLLARSNGLLFPTLCFDEVFSVVPRIVVDMGAIPYVCKGADVMVPGIRAINGDFKENSIIVVVDERHGKPLAVGLALFSSETMKALDRGKTVKNLHYVGDNLWSYLKTVSG